MGNVSRSAATPPHPCCGASGDGSLSVPCRCRKARSTQSRCREGRWHEGSGTATYGSEFHCHRLLITPSPVFPTPLPLWRTAALRRGNSMEETSTTNTSQLVPHSIFQSTSLVGVPRFCGPTHHRLNLAWTENSAHHMPAMKHRATGPAGSSSIIAWIDRRGRVPFLMPASIFICTAAAQQVTTRHRRRLSVSSCAPSLPPPPPPPPTHTHTHTHTHCSVSLRSDNLFGSCCPRSPQRAARLQSSCSPPA